MEAKYKVGDRVELTTAWNTHTGTVTDAGLYRIKWGEGDVTYEKESDLSYAKLSEEDAWLEVALMVGHTVREHMHICGGMLYESHAKEIRHKSYQILGGNGVKVTEEVKQRIRGLIERAKRV